MVALRTFDDLPPPRVDGMAVDAIRAETAVESEAWARYAGSSEIGGGPSHSRVCVDCDAGTGIGRDPHTGVLHFGTSLGAFALANGFDTFVFRTESSEDTGVLLSRVRELMPKGGAHFILDLDNEDALYHARDVGRVHVVTGPKVVVCHGTLARFPFALRELLAQLPKRELVVRLGSASPASWATLHALRDGERSLDLVIGIPRAFRDQGSVIEAATHSTERDQLTSQLGTNPWHSPALNNESARPRAIRLLLARRLRTHLDLHVGDEFVGSGRWSYARPLFASTREGRIARWRAVTAELTGWQDELYWDDAS